MVFRLNIRLFIYSGSNRFRLTLVLVLILAQVVLIGLDHLLDHLAAHRTGLTAGQVTIVTLLQVDAHLP